jgi:eukaryotic-like serine/threonine-protein kinase
VKVELSVTSGPCAGKVYRFDEPQGFTFGRAKDCTYVVENDDTFSRHHFLLEVNPSQVWLRDLGSLNGTFVNGRKVGGRLAGVDAEEAEPGETVSLRDGDKIKAGVYELLLKVEARSVCVDCGKEIPPEQRRGAEFIGGTYLCLQCREREEEKKRAPKPQPKQGASPPLKQDKQVRINPGQRERAEENPAAIIEELFKELLAQEGRNKQYPEIMGYRLEKKLGEGGFGAVYAAIRTADGRRVAVKTILQTRKPDRKQLLMFEREKEISVVLRHPHIVHCEQSGCWNDIHFIEMEYMDGGCVGSLLERKGKLSFDEAAPIMLQVLEGLAFAHRAELHLTFEGGKKTVRGIVHRDLKPPNILLAGSPDRWTAKVSDFGLAKAFSEAGMTKGEITVPGMTVGSRPYMAPEHVTNYRNLKPSTDVFEMAAAFYHMLTGSFVWNIKRGADPYRAILQGIPEPIRSRDKTIPKPAASVIDRALSREPAARYQDGSQFLAALKKAL